MHSDAWRYLKQLETAEKILKTMSVSKACFVTVFETIQNCWKKLKIMSLKNAFWQCLKRFGTEEKKKENSYWKRFGTAEKTLKTRMVNGAYWHLRIVETMWNFREKMKTMPLKHALWWDVKRFGIAEFL